MLARSSYLGITAGLSVYRPIATGRLTNPAVSTVLPIAPQGFLSVAASSSPVQNKRHFKSKPHKKSFVPKLLAAGATALFFSFLDKSTAQAESIENASKLPPLSQLLDLNSVLDRYQSVLDETLKRNLTEGVIPVIISGEALKHPRHIELCTT